MKLLIIIRDFLIATQGTVLSLLRILVLSKPLNGLKNESELKEVLILGNGPSLKTFLKLNMGFLENKIIFCVNYFARTEEYTLIKPQYYVICSPEYFIKEEKAEYQRSREETLKTIAERTTWPMTLIVPSLAHKNRNWMKAITQNPQIKIAFMNTTPIEGFRWFKHWAFSKGFGMPRPHNVLIPCIYLNIKSKAKTVFLTGADHSWLKEIFVNNNNEVLIGQKHFYDEQTTDQRSDVNKPKPKPMYKGETSRKRKLHEVLEKFYISFRSYWTLRQYADSRNVQIINLTSESFIDAFERQTLL